LNVRLKKTQAFGKIDHVEDVDDVKMIEFGDVETNSLNFSFSAADGFEEQRKVSHMYFLQFYFLHILR
jgi:hypothetical protein